MKACVALVVNMLDTLVKSKDGSDCLSGGIGSSKVERRLAQVVLLAHLNAVFT